MRKKFFIITEYLFEKCLTLQVLEIFLFYSIKLKEKQINKFLSFNKFNSDGPSRFGKNWKKKRKKMGLKIACKKLWWVTVQDSRVNGISLYPKKKEEKGYISQLQGLWGTVGIVRYIFFFFWQIRISIKGRNQHKARAYKAKTWLEQCKNKDKVRKRAKETSKLKKKESKAKNSRLGSCRVAS